MQPLCQIKRVHLNIMTLRSFSARGGWFHPFRLSSHFASPLISPLLSFCLSSDFTSPLIYSYHPFCLSSVWFCLSPISPITHFACRLILVPCKKNEHQKFFCVHQLFKGGVEKEYAGKSSSPLFAFFAFFAFFASASASADITRVFPPQKFYMFICAQVVFACIFAVFLLYFCCICSICWGHALRKYCIHTIYHGRIRFAALSFVSFRQARTVLYSTVHCIVQAFSVVLSSLYLYIYMYMVYIHIWFYTFSSYRKYFYVLII